MGGRLDSGCKQKNPLLKDVYEKLARTFAPRLYFDPQERFFPVDLMSAVRNSSLWRLEATSPDVDTGAVLVKDTGLIDHIMDLSSASKEYFMTVGGIKEQTEEIDGIPHKFPVPLIDDIYELYSSGEIAARLTIYASVCRANEAINSHLVNQPGCKGGDKELRAALAEGGLIINYYMYFPAYESPEFEAEGYWSGISIILPPPVIDESGGIDVRDPGNQPIFAVYYKKVIPWIYSDDWKAALYFTASYSEFRRWESVTKERDADLGMDTHPVVYISLGRHNCYFEPMEQNISIMSGGLISPDSIENGELSPGPSDRTITGTNTWDSEAIFISELSLAVGSIFVHPLIILFFLELLIVSCATGCEPYKFDPVVDIDNDTEDKVDEGGYHVTQSDSGSEYPTSPSSDLPEDRRNLDFELVYVDLENRELETLWTYEGAWGGAVVLNDYASDGSLLRQWGYYQGFRRPILSAWFLWDLFRDWTYGCAGTVEEPTP